MKTMDMELGRFETRETVYKKLALIELANSPMSDVEAAKLVRKAQKQREHYYSFLFAGEEPMANLEVINQITAEYDSKYELITSAPKQYWWANGQEESWKKFDKITIKRLAISDAENDKLLGMNTLSMADYKMMDPELKEKIIFMVDTKKTKMQNLSDLFEFIKWAKDFLGIKKVVFLDDKNSQEWLDYQMARKEKMKKAYKAKEKQIEAVRNNCFDAELASKQIDIMAEKPLLARLAEELIKTGYHFKAQKAENGPEGFFDVRELQNSDKEVGFKTKTKHSELPCTIIYRDIHTI